MAHLLHIDSSIQGDASVSRALTARAAGVWKAANPEGTITHRDLGARPIPHLTTASGGAFRMAPDAQNPVQAATYALGLELAGEIRAADVVVLGMGLYNFGPPSSVKAWTDHLVIPGVTIDPATMTGLLGDTPLYALMARGGGYGEGTARHGWDHAEHWLGHVLSLLAIDTHVIVAELTMATINPAMADLIPLAEASRADAEAEIDALFSTAAV